MRQSKNKDLILTSVKIHKDLKENFEKDYSPKRFNFQKLMNRGLHLFLTDPEFREKIMGHNILINSGSL